MYVKVWIFKNSFMLNIVKLKFIFMSSKIWNGLVVNTLVHLHEILGSNLDECVRQCMLCVYTLMYHV
jgi:hypothetical protein